MRSVGAFNVNNLDFQYLTEQLLMLVSLVMLLIGSMGLLMTVFNIFTHNKVFLSEMYFVYSYMIVIGTFLLIYHKKIIVKGHRT